MRKNERTGHEGETLAPPPNDTQALAGKYLTSALGGEGYGVDVLRVREIIQLSTITSVPQMPPYFRGVINLRGKIIPVADLRRCFGPGETRDADHTCIVVVHVGSEKGGSVPTGLVVDGVEEVVNIAAAEIEQAPEFGHGRGTGEIKGMAKIKGTVKVLLDIDRVFASRGMNADAFASNPQPEHTDPLPA
jgi:purine-binding chemotaxis protein CheW